MVWARLSTHQNVGQNLFSIVGTFFCRYFLNSPSETARIGRWNMLGFLGGSKSLFDSTNLDYFLQIVDSVDDHCEQEQNEKVLHCLE